MAEQTKEIATLAGGCFWCLEAVYEQTQGIDSVISGYCGGHTPNPTYYEVCSGTTGHTETVQLTYNPQLITYQDILDIFFAIHDPTTLNAQGPDVGTQYRSAVFYHDISQKSIAEKCISDINASGIWKRPIVTEVTPLGVFHPAEAYHQEYFRSNYDQPYCQIIINPKMAKFRQQFAARLKSRSI